MIRESAFPGPPRKSLCCGCWNVFARRRHQSNAVVSVSGKDDAQVIGMVNT